MSEVMYTLHGVRKVYAGRTVLDINIPEFKLRIVEKGDTIYTFPVRVGQNRKRYLLATDKARAALQPVQRTYFAPHTELTPLLDAYESFPNEAQVDTGSPAYFTHFPNDPAVGHADRTIDYFFYSPGLACEAEAIRQITGPRISDHFPMFVTVQAP